MTNKETTVRTFRLSKLWDDILNEDAQKQSISTSALLNQIVERYIVLDRFVGKTEAVVFDVFTLKLFLDKLSDEQIMEIGVFS